MGKLKSGIVYIPRYLPHLSLGSNITYIIRTGGGNGCMHNCLQWVESFPLSFDFLFSSGGYMPLARLEEGVVTSRH